MNRQISSYRGWRALAEAHPSAFLLAAQFISLVLYAAFDGSANGWALLGVFGVLVLILVVWVITHSPALNWIAWILVVPAIILLLLSIWFAFGFYQHWRYKVGLRRLFPGPRV